MRAVSYVPSDQGGPSSIQRTSRVFPSQTSGVRFAPHCFERTRAFFTQETRGVFPIILLEPVRGQNRGEGVDAFLQGVLSLPLPNQIIVSALLEVAPSLHPQLGMMIQNGSLSLKQVFLCEEVRNLRFYDSVTALRLLETPRFLLFGFSVLPFLMEPAVRSDIAKMLVFASGDALLNGVGEAVVNDLFARLYGHSSPLSLST